MQSGCGVIMSQSYRLRQYQLTLSPPVDSVAISFYLLQLFAC